MALNQNSNLLTNSIITKESIMQLEGNAVLSTMGDWKYSSMFAKEADQIGDSLRVRRPILSTILEDDMTWVGNKPFESQVELKIDKSFLTPLYFSEADMTLRIEKFSSRFIEEAVAQLAVKIDKYFYGKVQESCHWSVGQYETPITSDTILAAKELLDASSMPQNSEVYGILTPKHSRSLSNAQIVLFNAQKEISDIYRKGKIGTFAGIQFSESTTSPTHTDGSVWTGNAGSFDVSVAGLTSGWAETSTITVSGFTVGRTVAAGDVFTLSGVNGKVYNYNPLVGGQTPYVQQFVVREAVASTLSAGQTLVISPALVLSGEYQNCVGVTGVVQLKGYSNTSATMGQEGLIFHKSAIAMASPSLSMPKGTDKMAQESGEATDLKIRYSRDWNSINNVYVTRLDCLVGIKVLRPEWCARVR